MRGTWKRVLSTLLTIAMIATLFVVPAVAAEPADGKYVLTTSSTFVNASDETVTPAENVTAIESTYKYLKILGAKGYDATRDGSNYTAADTTMTNTDTTFDAAEDAFDNSTGKGFRFGGASKDDPANGQARMISFKVKNAGASLKIWWNNTKSSEQSLTLNKDDGKGGMTAVGAAQAVGASKLALSVWTGLEKDATYYVTCSNQIVYDKIEVTDKAAVSSDASVSDVVAAIKAAIGEGALTVDQVDCADETAAKSYVEGLYSAVSASKPASITITAAIDNGSFQAATAGTNEDRDGNPGSFSYTITVTDGTDTDSTTKGNVTITATAFSKAATSVTLSGAPADAMAPKATTDITVTVEPSDTTDPVTVESSNDKVVSVAAKSGEPGKYTLTAEAIGTATITVTAGSLDPKTADVSVKGGDQTEKPYTFESKNMGEATTAETGPAETTVYDNIFTLYATAGQDKISSSEKSWTDNYSSGLRFQAGKKVTTSAHALKFAAAKDDQVKVWWVSGDPDSRVIKLIDSSNNAVTGTTTPEATGTKSTPYITTYNITTAGDYYLGAAQDGSVYIYKVEIAAVEKTREVSFTLPEAGVSVAEVKQTATLTAGDGGKYTANTTEDVKFKLTVTEGYTLGDVKVNDGSPISPDGDGYYTIAAGADAAAVTVAATKNPLTMNVEITVPTGDALKYDGQNKTVTVKVTGEDNADITADATIKFATEENGEYTTNQPEMKTVDKHTVWVQVEATDYTTVKKSAEFTIIKADAPTLDVTLSKDSFTSTGGDVTVTIKNVPAESTVAPTVECTGATVKTAVAKADTGSDYTATLTLPAHNGNSGDNDYTISVNWAGDTNYTGLAAAVEKTATVHHADAVVLNLAEGAGTDKDVVSGGELKFVVAPTVEGGATATYSYAWALKGEGGNTPVEGTTATLTIADAKVATHNGKTYVCTVTATVNGTDSEPKTLEFTAEVTKLAAPAELVAAEVVTAAPTTADGNGTITVTGKGKWEYQVENGNTWTEVSDGTAVQVAPGKYLVRVKVADANEQNEATGLEVTVGPYVPPSNDVTWTASEDWALTDVKNDGKDVGNPTSPIAVQVGKTLTFKLTVKAVGKIVDTVTAAGATLTPANDVYTVTMGNSDVTLAVTLKEEEKPVEGDMVLDLTEEYPDYSGEVDIKTAAKTSKDGKFTYQGNKVKKSTPAVTFKDGYEGTLYIDFGGSFQKKDLSQRTVHFTTSDKAVVRVYWKAGADAGAVLAIVKDTGNMTQDEVQDAYKNPTVSAPAGTVANGLDITDLKLTEGGTYALYSGVQKAYFYRVEVYEGVDEAPVILDKAALTKAIDDAETALKGVKPSADGKDVLTDEKWATAEAIKAVQDKLDAAKAALTNAKTQEDINTAATELDAATKAFQPQAGTWDGTSKDFTVKSVALKVDGKAVENGVYTVDMDTVKTVTLTAEVDVTKADGSAADDSAKGVTWESSNPNVATVEGGVVTFLKTGKTTITATAEKDLNKSASVEITVDSTSKPRPKPYTELDYTIVPPADGTGKYDGGTELDTGIEGVTLTLNVGTDYDWYDAEEEGSATENTYPYQGGMDGVIKGSVKPDNGIPGDGTAYKFTIAKNGTLKVGYVVFGTSKKNVTVKTVPATGASTEEVVNPSFSGNGFSEIKVEAGCTYYVYAPGSNVGLYGFSFTEDSDQPVDKDALKAAIAKANVTIDVYTVEDDVTADQVTVGEHFVGKTAKATYQAAIDEAQKVVDNKDATQEQVDQAIKDLAAATTAFEAACGTGTKPATADDLAGAIEKAKAAKEGIVTGATAAEVDKGKDFVTEEEMTALDDAIKDAEEVAANKDATPEQIHNATEAINTAVKTFKAAIKHGAKEEPVTVDKDDLKAAITAAEAAKKDVKTSTDGKDIATTAKWVTEGAMKALTDAITKATGVVENAAATQTQVDDAVTELNGAVTTFNAAKKDGTKEEPAPTTYTVTVTGGTTDKAKAAEGDKVTVTAGAAAEGKVFDKWTATGITLTDAQAATNPLTITMPAADVAFTATYKDDQGGDQPGPGPEKPVTLTGKYVFDATKIAVTAVNTAVTNDMVKAATTVTTTDAKPVEAMFTMDGTLTTKWETPEGAPTAAGAVELAKKEQGKIIFTIPEGNKATVKVGVSSTNATNESAYAMKKDGTVVPNDGTLISVVTGNTKTEIVYTDLGAGTYEIVSPEDADRSRGMRVWSVEVDFGGSTEPGPGPDDPGPDDPAKVDKTALTNAITAANTAKEGVKTSTDGKDVATTDKWVTEGDKATLDTAIATAQAVVDNKDATQTDVDNAVKALNAAVETFNAAVKTGTKTVSKEDLTKALADAADAKKGISVNAGPASSVSKGTKFVSKAVMDALDEAIKTAQAVADKEDATAEEITKAVSDLNAAVETFTGAIETGTKTSSGGRPSSSRGDRGDTSSETTTKPDGSKTTVVTDRQGNTTTTTKNADGSEIKAVKDADGDVTITVTDAEGDVAVKVKLPATVPSVDRFEDVPEGHWAEKSINEMAGLELVKGVDEAKHIYDMVSPVTRGSIASILFRFSQGKEGMENIFTDVAEGEWYTDSVAWANKVGVVTGYEDGTFGPNNSITREQLATMLYRYAKLLGLDVSTKGSLSKFSDGSAVQSWASEAMSWAVGVGILQGRGDGTVDPAASTSRAEAAVMLQRFIDLVR